MRIKSIGVRDLKAHASALLQEIQRGDLEVLITVRGRPVARLLPLSTAGPRPPVDGMGGLRGALSGFPHLEWEDFQAAKQLVEPRPLNEE